jgi:hypothetical protein
LTSCTPIALIGRSSTTWLLVDLGAFGFERLDDVAGETEP